jgi:NOL1/NOP2/fmu family ribosome biogenesis protein
MSRELNNDAFPAIDVNYDQAIAYLRKEVIQLPTGLPRSYVLLTYRQIPIGFVKNIGSRANNLYPQEWRIRSSFLPEKVICL